MQPIPPLPPQMRSNPSNVYKHSLKWINKNKDVLQDEIIKTQNELYGINDSINKLIKVQNDLNRKLQIEYNIVGEDINDVNKRINRTIRYITDSIKYIRENETVKRDMEEEYEKLYKYISKRFQNKEIIKSIKQSLEKILPELNKLIRVKNEIIMKIDRLVLDDKVLVQRIKNAEIKFNEKLKLEMMEFVNKQNKKEKKKEMMKQMMRSMTLGGSKKKKRVRKHKGINRQTGKLKKGYKYSGKKLKSGLAQIVKV